MSMVKMVCTGLISRFFSVTFDSLESVERKELTYNDMDGYSHSFFLYYLKDGSR